MDGFRLTEAHTRPGRTKNPYSVFCYEEEPSWLDLLALGR